MADQNSPAKKGSVLKGTTVVLASKILGYVLSFARNIILARILLPADFGLAAAFATTVSFLELSGRFGLAQLVIQSKQGDSLELGGSVQTVQLLGGCISALLILALAMPMAALFKVPGEAWAFALLAVIPILGGLCHLDNWRVQRQLDFVPAAVAEIIPQIIVTAAAWPLAHAFNDVRAILIILIAKALLGTLITHLYATNPFRLLWNPSNFRFIISWGWPLLLSGLVVFASQQADQMIIGGAFSVATLAGYAIAASLISVPWFITANVTSSIMLPVLSRVQSDEAELRQIMANFMGFSAVAAALLFIPLALCGEQLILFLYGASYEGFGIYVAIFAVGLSFRILRTVATLSALAVGDTKNELLTNVWRTASLPLAILSAWLGGSPALVASCVVLGELIGFCAALVRLRYFLTLPLKETFISIGYVVSVILITFALREFGPKSTNLFFELAISTALALASLSVVPFLFPKLYSMVFSRGIFARA